MACIPNSNLQPQRPLTDFSPVSSTCQSCMNRNQNMVAIQWLQIESLASDKELVKFILHFNIPINLFPFFFFFNIILLFLHFHIYFPLPSPSLSSIPPSLPFSTLFYHLSFSKFSLYCFLLPTLPTFISLSSLTCSSFQFPFISTK